MIADSQLSEYMDGALGEKEQKLFLEMAAGSDEVIAELISQQRVHQALLVLRFGETEGRQADSVRELKRSIMREVCGKESRKSANMAVTSEPGLIQAAICLALTIALAISLCFLAPRPPKQAPKTPVPARVGSRAG
jgi:hypothetical protein